jgi:predicted phage tail protein
MLDPDWLDKVAHWKILMNSDTRVDFNFTEKKELTSVDIENLELGRDWMRKIHVTEKAIRFLNAPLAKKYGIEKESYQDFIDKRSWAKYNPVKMYNYVMELRSTHNVWLEVLEREQVRMEDQSRVLQSNFAIPVKFTDRGVLDFQTMGGKKIDIDDTMTTNLMIVYVKEMRNCWGRQWKIQEEKEAKELVNKKKNKLLTKRIRNNMRERLFQKHFQKRMKQFLKVLTLLVKFFIKKGKLFQLKAAGEKEEKEEDEHNDDTHILMTKKSEMLLDSGEKEEKEEDEHNDDTHILMTKNLEMLLDSKLDKSRFLEFYDQELVRFNTNFRDFRLTLQSQAVVQENLTKKMEEIESVKYIILNEIAAKKELILRTHAQQAAIYAKETSLSELIETVKVQFDNYTTEVKITRKEIENERTMNEKIRINLTHAQLELKQTKEALRLIKQDVTKAIENLEKAAKEQISEVFDAKEWVSKSLNKKIDKYFSKDLEKVLNIFKEKANELNDKINGELYNTVGYYLDMTKQKFSDEVVAKCLSAANKQILNQTQHFSSLIDASLKEMNTQKESLKNEVNMLRKERNEILKEVKEIAVKREVDHLLEKIKPVTRAFPSIIHTKTQSQEDEDWDKMLSGSFFEDFKENWKSCSYLSATYKKPFDSRMTEDQWGWQKNKNQLLKVQ